MKAMHSRSLCWNLHILAGLGFTQCHLANTIQQKLERCIRMLNAKDPGKFLSPKTERFATVRAKSGAFYMPGSSPTPRLYAPNLVVNY